MAEIKNVAIWAAGIGAAATIVAAIFGYLGTRQSHDSHTDSSTTRGPSATAVRPPIATSRTAVGTVRVPKPNTFAWVYEVPVANPNVGHVGQISDGQRIEIVCTVQGPPVTTPYATSTLWDKIKWGTGYGFIADATVATGAVPAVAPQC
jgi:hypothetical protein